MIKEELEKEAKKSCIDKTHYCIGGFGGNAYCEGYIDSAKSREKRIAELEAQIEKMKCCQNCKHFDKLYNRCEKIQLTLKSALCTSLDKWELRR